MVWAWCLVVWWVWPGHYVRADDGLPGLLQNIAIPRMVQDVETLSSPPFEGRQAGTPGGHRSALYVADHMKSAGLLPAGTMNLLAKGEAWFQGEPIPVTRLPGTPTLDLALIAPALQRRALHATLGSEFLPILDSPAVKVTAPVVFVGYGISDPAHGVDDYRGIDVRNRIVLFLRGKPPTYPKWVTHAEKEQVAREKGAFAFLTGTGPILSRYEARRGLGSVPLALYSNVPDERPIPGCWVSGDLIERLLAHQGLSLREIQKRLNLKLADQSQPLEVIARMEWDSHQKVGSMINVLGVVPGKDPKFHDETVILGAHRDHFGRQVGLLFAGADDNASGTALLLEIARVWSQADLGFKRTVVFVSFSGEEQGLLGSKLYTRHPVRPLGNTIAMINVDHVGVGNGKLTVGVSNLPKEIAQQAADLVALSNEVDIYGFFPGGDHVPFAKAKVPTIAVVSSGIHESFHQATDTADTINPAILHNATRYVLALTWLLANP